MDKAISELKKLGPSVVAGSYNVMAGDFEENCSTMFGANLPRLRELKEIHDPLNLFSMNANLKTVGGGAGCAGKFPESTRSAMDVYIATTGVKMSELGGTENTMSAETF